MLTPHSPLPSSSLGSLRFTFSHDSAQPLNRDLLWACGWQALSLAPNYSKLGISSLGTLSKKSAIFPRASCLSPRLQPRISPHSTLRPSGLCKCKSGMSTPHPPSGVSIAQGIKSTLEPPPVPSVPCHTQTTSSSRSPCLYLRSVQGTAYGLCTPLDTT